jgi:glycosyltransferase involved in cell wall biosynthesis
LILSLPLIPPTGKYIAQVARFDPSKGIPTVIEAYAEFRRMCDEDGIIDTPQLCMYVLPPFVSTGYGFLFSLLKTAN